MPYKIFNQIHYIMKDTLNMKFIILCSLLTIPLFAQAEKCEDAFPASQTSAVSYNARDIARRNRNWMHFEDAKTFIQNQALKTMREFQKWSSSGQRPKNFPANPNIIYKDQWTSWGEFLGTETIAHKNKEWMHFEDARTFIQTQGIQTFIEFQEWSRSRQRPKNFPSHPNETYKDQWTGWRDFLGTRDIARRNRNWMHFEDAKTFIQNQGIQTSTEFRKWSSSGQRPENFPSNPDNFYRYQWTGWGYFLGTDNIANRNKEWMHFEDAKTFIQNQGIQTLIEFHKWSKSGRRPENFPSNPYKIYRSQWTGWGNFLGTKNISRRKRNWMPFKDAKTFIQKQGIQTLIEFKKWSSSGQRPENFPSTPNRTYKDQWTSWGHFLGTKNTSRKKRKWMSFEDAKTFIQNQGIRTSTEFQKWSSSGQRPENFPSNPYETYKDQWTGWGDFLSTGAIAHKNKKWMSFEDAKAFIQN